MTACDMSLYMPGIDDTATTPQRSATHYTALQRTVTHCNAATHCSALQRTATHCSALQRTATHFHTVQHTLQHMYLSGGEHHVLQHATNMYCTPNTCIGRTITCIGRTITCIGPTITCIGRTIMNFRHGTQRQEFFTVNPTSYEKYSLLALEFQST